MSQRISRLRNQEDNSKRAAALLLTLHTIKVAKINVSATSAAVLKSLARSIRRDDAGSDCASTGAAATGAAATPATPAAPATAAAAA